MNVAKLPSQIFIGYEADNAWTPVVIDWTEWAEKEPGGVLTVLLQRNGDTNPYPVVLTTDGTVSTWKPSSTDTAVPGFGRLQLKYTVGDVVGHSKVLNVNIGRSLEPATDPPDPYESWLDTLTELAAETEQYANSAQQSAEDAEDAQTAAEAAQQSAEGYATSAEESAQSASLSAQNASASETNAALFESNAQGYAVRAETAQTRAESAQSGAESARDTAVASATSAGQSAASAGASASSAESSASSAASSASSASASATLAGESATSASGSASSASESASSATQSATQAAQSASSASQSATQASGSASSASQSATAASASATSASESATSASASSTSAEASAESAAQSASEALETLLDTAPVITDTASGAIASFSDGADGRPVVGLNVTIEPIQSGSGDPSPTNIRPITGHTQAVVTRTGRNLFDYSTFPESASQSGVTLTNNGDGSFTINGTATGEAFFDLFNYQWSTNKGGTPRPSGTYRLTGCPPGGGVNTFGLYLRPTYSNDYGSGVTFTNTIIGGSMRVSSGQTFNNVRFTPMVRYADQGDDTFVPYQAQTITIPFGSTVYGGTVDVVNGVLTAKRVIEVKTWGELTNATDLGDNVRRKFAFTHTPKYTLTGAENDLICNVIGAYNASYSADSVHMYIANTEYAWVYLPDSTESSTVIQLSYSLAEPISIDLTPQQLTTLLGDNNIWADTGSTEVEYRADTKKYIAKMIASALNS